MPGRYTSQCSDCKSAFWSPTRGETICYQCSTAALYKSQLNNDPDPPDPGKAKKSYTRSILDQLPPDQNRVCACGRDDCFYCKDKGPIDMTSYDGLTPVGQDLLKKMARTWNKRRDLMEHYGGTISGAGMLDSDPPESPQAAPGEPIATCPDHPGEYGLNCVQCDSDRALWRAWRDDQ